MKLCTTIVLALITVCTFAQNTKKAQELYDFGNRIKGYYEGFEKNTGQNTFNYHSFRSDVGESLLTRSQKGNMEIRWQTQSISQDLQKKGAGFVWIAAYDFSNSPGTFSVKINGTERFTLNGKQNSAWKLSTEDGGSLEFFPVESDIHGDLHGYMALWAPESWLVKTKNQEISITGSTSGTDKWVIVYQAKDANQELQKSINSNTWVRMSLVPDKQSIKAEIEMPLRYAGKQVSLNSDSTKNNFVLIEMNGTARGGFSLNPFFQRQSFTLEDDKGVIASSRGLIYETKSGFLQNGNFISTEVIKGNPWYEIISSRINKPALFNQLMSFNDSPLGNGKIYLMSSSHQDIAWMDSPEACVIERDTMLITPMLEFIEKDNQYRFDIEDALMIKEYIARHPERKGKIRSLLKNGQISCGATYIQPYEEMYSGESLIRQFYFGKRWLKSEFGYDANVYWNVDVPGRTLQMPQIMKKSGVGFLMLSRHENGIFNWVSPDGSKVLAYSSSHYTNAYQPLRKEFSSAADFISGYALKFSELYKTANNAVIPLLSESDMSPAVDFSTLINGWKNIEGYFNSQNQLSPLRLPSIMYSTAPGFFEAAQSSGATFPSISGERPAVWLYIHGPTHHEAISSSRRGDILLTAAEKFATATCLVAGSFSNYPASALEKAWEAKIYPDHGWGGKNGHITDSTFLAKYRFAETTAQTILEKAMNEIASKVKLPALTGIPLVVFNSTSWKRSDVVLFSLEFTKGEAQNIEISDMEGKLIPVQISAKNNFSDGSFKTAEVSFVAANLPSVGYKTYFVKTIETGNIKTESKFRSAAENNFYKLTFGNGGLKSVIDKEFNRELIKSGKFNAGEVFTLHSFGNGAGEFSDIQPVDTDGYDKTGNYKSEWEQIESGPVFSSYRMKQKIRNTEIESEIVLYNLIKKIDFNISILEFDGEKYREFRMALPLNLKSPELTYEVPFGTVTVGKDEIQGAAGERYITPCKDVHPRGIENWISASNPDFGITLSSSVAVVDYIDPTDNPADYTIIQPILLASRKSCHHLGNYYLQPGNHHYSFSLTSGNPGIMESTKFGRQANEKLYTVVAAKPYADASLPSELSFFNSGNESLIISTVKKAEDSNEPVIRIYNLDNTEKNAEIEIFKPVSSAEKVSLIEYLPEKLNINNGKIYYPFGKYAIETFKCNTAH